MMKTKLYPRIRSLFVLFILGFLWCACQPEGTRVDGASSFAIYETSISEFHEALLQNQTSIEEVMQYYLNRIGRYDQDTTELALRSVISINPHALQEAKEKDKHVSKEKLQKFPLYGVPILIKDNINTAEIPTSGGALAFRDNQPTTDAFVVDKLREAGAIVLGKANLSEFAFDYKGKSSLGGQVKNAYNPQKGPGGSSSGTGTAISSNFAMVGLGTDTGGSIRIPASLSGLVGLRPTMNLISQSGIMPLSPWQDTVGPMCRKTEDCALLLEVMTGFDKDQRGNQRIAYQKYIRLFNNEQEYLNITQRPEHYTSLLDSMALKGVRIGVVRDLFGKDSIALNLVNPTIERALDSMSAAGAEIKEVNIRDLDAILKNYRSMSSIEFKSSLETYLNSWSVLKDHHILDYKELLQSDGYLSDSKQSLVFRDSVDIYDLTPEQRELYGKNVVERPLFVRPRLMEALDGGQNPEDDIDVLLYPAIIGMASKLGEQTRAGQNNRLSPFSGFPAITFPAGMVLDDQGVEAPVGIELLARPYAEATLLKIAYAYEVLFHPRKPPKIAVEEQ